MVFQKGGFFPLFAGEGKQGKGFVGKRLGGGWDHILLSSVKNTFQTLPSLQMPCAAADDL